MGQVTGVQYDKIVGSSDNGFLFRFGEPMSGRSVWIHRGYIYLHDFQARIIAIPESLVLEKVLDPFRVTRIFPLEEKCTL